MSRIPLLISSFRGIRWIVGFMVLALTGLHAASETPKPEAKDFALYLGLDVSFEHDSAVHPLEQVTGSKVQIGKGSGIPIDSIRNYRLLQNLKLSLFKVTIDKLETKRAYSPSGDPMKKWGRTEVMMMDMQGKPSKAQGVGTSTGSVGISAPDIPDSVSGAKITGMSADRGQAENGRELFDALEISFDVSSEHPVEKPYVVVVTEYKDDAKSGAVARSVSTRSLYPLGSGKQSISLVQNGLPAGFTPLKTSVHVYSNGREFATNLSGNRIDMARNQACEYLVLQYLTANKGKTLPPNPSLMPLPKDLREHLDAKALEQPIFVRVNKYGIVESAYVGEKASKRADAYLMSVLAGFHFAPALEKGVPVPGSTTIKLSDFVL